ncbi:MAG: hypothetical protein JWR83_840, partial [Aeromicrobium sp.]|nr:hypothetical protein [Aeromicrobium sp.]
MLSRYTSEAMAEIWSDAARYERWRDVELAVLTAQVRTRDVPVEVLAIAEAAPTPSPAAVES